MEQALWARADVGGLVDHRDRGVQYLSIRYTERLAEAGIEPSVGSVGDSYDNALAKSVIGLFKTELIRRKGPWKGLDQLESRHSTGSAGTTTGAYSNRSAMFHPLSPKQCAIATKLFSP
jgi:transposase InsO family protein